MATLSNSAALRLASIIEGEGDENSPEVITLLRAITFETIQELYLKSSTGYSFSSFMDMHYEDTYNTIKKALSGSYLDGRR